MGQKLEKLRLSSHQSLQPLKTLPVEARFHELPQFLQELIRRAQTEIELEEIIVFGSRARGDEKPLSDWDLCFKFPRGKQTEWNKFSLDLSEVAETLLEIDAVSWDEAPSELLANIQKEGLTVWRK